ncbi:MAG TPA: hypothetical protein VMF33_07830 [Acidimicrobiales bacterium]|nr:hypothetical protein [Acidimicrobiales bacterium]
MAWSQLAHPLDATVSCSLCDAQLEHCHGVAIVAQHVAVCSDDPDCTVTADLHQFVSYED